MWMLITLALAGGPMTDPETAVRTFVSGADAQSVDVLETVLHPEFRVVAQMPDGVSVLDRSTYLALVGGKKIGGVARKASVDGVETTGDLATVRGHLESEKARFDSVWTMVRTDSGWQVVQDATRFTPRP